MPEGTLYDKELVGQPVEDADPATDTNAAIMNAIGAQSRIGWAKIDEMVQAGGYVDVQMRSVTPARLAAFHASLRQQGFKVAPLAPPDFEVELPDLDYTATNYDGLQTEISDGLMGETGDLIREHARAVIALRLLIARLPEINMVADDIKRIDITEFREVGFLQEVNRQFLHPLGLALEVIQEHDGTERLGGVWDYRDDPEGTVFGEGMLTEEKAENVAVERRKHIDARRELFHQPSFAYETWIQPLEAWPTECIEDPASEPSYHIGPWEHVPGSDSASRCAACGVVHGK